MSTSISKDFRLFSLLRFALPSMVMMVFMSLYTIVDGIFISRFIGSNALSAANIVYPVLSLLIALGVMFATGGSALIARKMGEGNTQEAREDFSLITLVGVLLSLLLMVIGFVGLTPICRMLGATDILLADCQTYLGILLLFSVPCILQILFQTFFVTAGKPTLGLVLTIAGGVANTVLDYLFMGPFQMGIAGAAYATGIGQLIPAAAGIIYFLFIRNGSLYLVKPRFRIQTLFKSCTNGSSEMVTNISNAVVTYLFNIVMLEYLGEPGVAAITIVLYGQFLFNALYMGFSMGAAPIISYNYGRQNVTLLKRVFKICIGFIVVSSAIVTAFALIASPVIVEIFTPVGSSTYEIAKDGFFLFSFNFLFAGINIFSSALFTAFSDGPVSAAISFARTFVFLVASILLLPKIFGVNGIWFSVPVAEAITLFLSIYFLISRHKKYNYF